MSDAGCRALLIASRLRRTAGTVAGSLELRAGQSLIESTTSTTVYPYGALQFHTSSTIHLAVSTFPCPGLRGTTQAQGSKREGQWLGPRAVSRAMRGAYSAVLAHQLAVLGLAHWHLHLALATFPACSIPIFRPERNRHKGQNARVSGGRAPSFARALRGGAHSPQFSRISLWCRDLHLGTCIGKRNGEERARPACKGRLVGGAYSGSRKIRR